MLEISDFLKTGRIILTLMALFTFAGSQAQVKKKTTAKPATQAAKKTTAKPAPKKASAPAPVPAEEVRVKVSEIFKRAREASSSV